jgi:hypothetical protein
MMDITQRTSRAVESLIENEALTAHLDDQTAKLLLQWGIDCAKNIVQDTEGMTDDEAEEAMYGRMRALRRMLRRIDRWVPQRRSAGVDTNAAFLSQVTRMAATVYGREAGPIQDGRKTAFLRASLADAPAQVVRVLRQTIQDRYQGEEIQ